MLSDCGVKSNKKDSSIVAFQSNENKYCQFIRLYHSHHWCHLNLVATITCLFKNPGVSKKVKASFVVTKTIVIDFTAQSLAVGRFAKRYTQAGKSFYF